VFKEFVAGREGPSLRTLAIIVAVAAVVIGLATSYYQGEPDEGGVGRRLGGTIGTSGRARTSGCPAASIGWRPCRSCAS
jgi:regulator of protease activity HflC (stomatin/prohibitin superfamily)